MEESDPMLDELLKQANTWTKRGEGGSQTQMGPPLRPATKKLTEDDADEGDLPAPERGGDMGYEGIEDSRSQESVVVCVNLLTVIIPAKAREYVFTGVGLSVCLPLTTITKKLWTVSHQILC